MSLVNPTQVFKVMTVDTLQGNLELLGPAGLYATDILGNWLGPCLLSLLAVWTVLPLALSAILLRSRGVI